MSKVKWAAIEAECGDYRDGFISVFKKYEGQDTDERTKQGKVVQVTTASFARHMGIPERTFRQWTKDRVGTRRRHGLRDEQGTKKLLRENPQAIVEAINEAGPEARAAVQDGLLQTHPATAKRSPLGMPKERTYGFTAEMSGPSQSLLRAIDNYVEVWDRLASDASEEELQTERDLVAPKLLNLRMTIEGGVPA